MTFSKFDPDTAALGETQNHAVIHLQGGVLAALLDFDDTHSGAASNVDHDSQWFRPA